MPGNAAPATGPRRILRTWVGVLLGAAVGFVSLTLVEMKWPGDVSSRLSLQVGATALAGGCVASAVANSVRAALWSGAILSLYYASRVLTMAYLMADDAGLPWTEISVAAVAGLLAPGVIPLLGAWVGGWVVVRIHGLLTGVRASRPAPPAP